MVRMTNMQQMHNFYFATIIINANQLPNEWHF